jgi:hypothetical protein
MAYRKVSLALLLITALRTGEALTKGHEGVCTRTEYYQQPIRIPYFRVTYSHCKSWLCTPNFKIGFNTINLLSSREVLYCCPKFREINDSCQAVCSPSCARGICGTDFRCHCPAGWTGITCAVGWLYYVHLLHTIMLCMYKL